MRERGPIGCRKLLGKLFATPLHSKFANFEIKRGCGIEFTKQNVTLFKDANIHDQTVEMSSNFIQQKEIKLLLRKDRLGIF